MYFYLSQLCCSRPVEPAIDDAVEKQDDEKTVSGIDNKPNSWPNNVGPNIDHGKAIIYTYEECAFIFDRINFVAFLISEAILTVCFFSAIVVGGENSLEQ